jgi:glyoxylase-like metal-dependent hydrolase (beta-lactamase superfamily II)
MGLYLKQLQVGPMQNYVYLIGDTETRKVVAVDPAWDVGGIVDVLEKDDMVLESVLITHFHPDHIGGSLMGHNIEGPTELLERGYEIKVYIHKSEADFVPQVCGLSKSDLTLTESGDDLVIGEQRIQFLHTPGHTPGSQCFLVHGNLVSGDTLFIGGCGRVDLPGSNPAEMYDSLNNKLKALPDDTILYPGHNYSPTATSTIGAEKRTNPYMRFARLEDFLGVMGY